MEEGRWMLWESAGARIFMPSLYEITLVLSADTTLEKVSEYHRNAQACREMALATVNPDHKAMLENMAETWGALAKNREATIARRERIANLESE